MNNKNVLKSLTSVALALPGVNTLADQIATDTSISLRHYQYGEDSLPSNLAAAGRDIDRYDIDTTYLKIVTPVNSDVDFSFTYQTETMTGASPWYVSDYGDGVIKQVMTGASIEEDRDFYSATTRIQRDLRQFGLTLSKSTENDYDSNTMGVSYQKESEDRQQTYTVGFEISDDEINAVQKGNGLFENLGLVRVQGESKKTKSVFLDYSWIIDKNSIAKVAFGYSDNSGYLSDPYKIIFNPIAGVIESDSRPDSKKQKTASFKYRHFLPSYSSALHFNALYYEDDWNITSYTLETAWYYNVSDQLQIAPSYRYYAQADSFFYRNVYQEERADGYYSTDYRLSSYGATTIGLTGVYSLDKIRFTLSYERYNSDFSKGLDNDEPANVGLVDFDTVGFGMDYIF